jgi:hypothetical protein
VGDALQGTWSGYAQGEGHDYDFTLVLGGGEAPCGTLTFGESQVYPDATDPEVPFPGNDGGFKYLERAPGFSYSLLGFEVDGARVRFRVAYSEPYASWCGLQTSYPNPHTGGYSCLPSYGTGVLPNGTECTTPDGQHVYECDHYSACLSAVQAPCACDSSGCIADVESAGASFDLRFDESDASGEMSDKSVFLEKE